jgi:uncharacterized protein (TIGR03435 family)
MLLSAVMGIAFVQTGWSQGATTAAKSFTYDAVSVKPNKSLSNLRRTMFLGDRFSATGATVKQLIVLAYHLKMEEQIVGSLGPVGGLRFDVEAKMDDETIEAMKKVSQEQSFEMARPMLQAMLADRFKLVVHRETKELPIYALIVAKSGFKLKEADPNDSYANGIKGPDGVGHAGFMRIGPGSLTVQGSSLKEFASVLALQVKRLVVDKTGIPGKFDISLRWSKDENRADGQDNGAVESGPSLVTAIQEQIGLKLEPTKGPVETIVIDHVEMPSEN